MKVISSAQLVKDGIFFIRYLRNCQKKRNKHPLYFFSPSCEELYKELIAYLKTLDFLKESQIEEAKEDLLKIARGDKIYVHKSLNVQYSQQILNPYLEQLNSKREASSDNTLIDSYLAELKKRCILSERVSLLQLLTAWLYVDRAKFVKFLNSHSRLILDRVPNESKFSSLELRYIDSKLKDECGQFSSDYFILCIRQDAPLVAPDYVCHYDLRNFQINIDTAALLWASLKHRRGRELKRVSSGFAG